MSSEASSSSIGSHHTEHQVPKGNVDLIADMKKFKSAHEDAIHRNPSAESVDILKDRRDHVIQLITALNNHPDYKKGIREQYQHMLDDYNFTGTGSQIDSEASGEIHVGQSDTGTDIQTKAS